MQVFSAKDLVDRIDDHGWTVRAEPVPPGEEALSDSDRLLHVYHFQFDEARKQVGAVPPRWGLLA